MAVDGERVEGVALGQAAHAAPLGEEPAEQVVPLERFDGVHHRLSGAEQAEERTTRPIGPRLARLAAAAGHHPQRARPDGIAGVRGRCGHAEHERLLVDLGVGRQLRFVVDEGDTSDVIGQLPGRTLAAAFADAVDAPPEPLGRPFDRVRSRRHVEHQCVGVDVAHRLRDAVLVLQQQRVDEPARGAVQLASCGQQHLGGCGEVFERALQRMSDLGTIDCERPPDHVVIAQSTATVFQVRLEQRRHVAQTGPPQLCRLVQPLQPDHRLAAPLLERVGLDLVGDALVACDAPEAQDGGGRLEVVTRQMQQRLRRVHTLTEFDAAVPQRVPQALGHLAHLRLGGLRRVDQNDVDIAARRQHPARVAAGGHQCPSCRQAVAEALEPGIDLLRQPSGEAPPREIRVSDQPGAPTSDHRPVDRHRHHAPESRSTGVDVGGAVGAVRGAEHVFDLRGRRRRHHREDRSDRWRRRQGLPGRDTDGPGGPPVSVIGDR